MERGEHLGAWPLRSTQIRSDDSRRIDVDSRV